MELFQQQFEFINTWLTERAKKKQLKRLTWRQGVKWPIAGQRNLVIGRDIGVELGHPDHASVAVTLWGPSTDSPERGSIYLVGPDLTESTGMRLPFAKVVMLRGSGFDAHNTYSRYRRLESVRYEISLKGYMMRAVSQVNREWSRVSNQALLNGFSFEILGSALKDAFTAIDFLDGVEILFVTSSRADVMAFHPLAERIQAVTAAMSKMNSELTADCDNCSYANVCEQVAGLRAMRRSRERGNG